MPNSSAYRLWLVPLVLLGLALLATTLLVAQPAWGQALLGRPLPPVLVNVGTAVLVGGIFYYCRTATPPVLGTDFVTPLRRLFFGPALLAFVASIFQLSAELLASALAPADRPALFNGVYVANVGLLAIFLCRLFFVWKSMMLFRATLRIATEWRTFEVLVIGVILVGILVPQPPPGIHLLAGVLLALFGTYLNLANQRWVTHLLRAEKTQALFLLLALLLMVAVFILVFDDAKAQPGLIGSATQLGLPLQILTLTTIYLLGGLLTTGFNFPAAAVYEQRREELLAFQRQCQEIQRSASSADVYERLLASARRASDADVAWLQPPGGEPLLLSEGLPEATALALTQQLRERGVESADYVNRDLSNVPGFRDLNLPWQSLLTLPLAREDSEKDPGMLGLLKIASRGFDRGAVELAQVFVNQTQLTLRNMRLMKEAVESARYKRELKIASEVQESLIPRQLPADHMLDISVWAQAATEVGGDFYDFRQLSKSQLAIIVGDVSGKGITAAFHVAQMKGIFHSLMQLDHVPEPDRFMVKANAALAYCLERSSFITASIFVIDYEQRGFSFARAGHCHTLYYNAMTEQVFYFRTPGLGLGIVRDSSYSRRIEKVFYDFNPGDVMVLYTDGITEARSPEGEEYGEQRLLERLQHTHHYLVADRIRDALVADLEKFTADAPVRDDQTLLVIKFRTDEY